MSADGDVDDASPARAERKRSASAPAAEDWAAEDEDDAARAEDEELEARGLGEDDAAEAEDLELGDLDDLTRRRRPKRQKAMRGQVKKQFGFLSLAQPNECSSLCFRRLRMNVVF